MRIEHLALNVADPAGMADWYCRNLGLKIARSGDGEIPVRFIRCDGGMMLEFYRNNQTEKFDLPAVAPAALHLAFEADDVAGKAAAIVKAGAAMQSDVQTTADGDIVAMLRDPWGLPVQIVRRAKPML
ncbi:MAG: VOC family protein [Planctomycetes bacterium]|nr:VOC family protein [Planctomycetota bacterium]